MTVVRVYTVVSKNPLFKLEALYKCLKFHKFLFNILDGAEYISGGGEGQGACS